jgi:hypothetical protein
MPGRWKAWKSKSGFPTLSTAPWKSRKQREISTFPQPGFAAMEKWKTKSRFPTFPQPLATTILVLSFQTQKPGKEIGRYAASSCSLFTITLYWKRNSVSGSSLDWKMLKTDRGAKQFLGCTVVRAAPFALLSKRAQRRPARPSF